MKAMLFKMMCYLRPKAAAQVQVANRFEAFSNDHDDDIDEQGPSERTLESWLADAAPRVRQREKKQTK